LVLPSFIERAGVGLLSTVAGMDSGNRSDGWPMPLFSLATLDVDAGVSDDSGRWYHPSTRRGILEQRICAPATSRDQACLSHISFWETELARVSS